MSFFNTQNVGGGETLVAGTGAIAPLKFLTGTSNTVAVAGALEFDGASFYATVAASGRGVLPAEQWAILGSAYTLTSQTAAQRLLNASASGALTLAAGAYAFECEFALSSMSALSGSFGFALGGTATATQAWSANAFKAASLSTGASPTTTFNTAANVALVAANTATSAYARVAGVVRVTVAGTIIPQVSLGAAAAAVVSANSWFRAYPLGAAAVASIGNWS